MRETGFIYFLGGLLVRPPPDLFPVVDGQPACPFLRSCMEPPLLFRVVDLEKYTNINRLRRQNL